LLSHGKRYAHIQLTLTPSQGKARKRCNRRVV
jgi:hypothetical protein